MVPLLLNSGNSSSKYLHPSSHICDRCGGGGWAVEPPGRMAIKQTVRFRRLSRFRMFLVNVDFWERVGVRLEVLGTILDVFERFRAFLTGRS